MKYDSENEAIVAANESSLKQTSVICPLLRDCCEARCQCYENAKVVVDTYSEGEFEPEVETGTFSVRPAYCNNGMFN